MRLPLLIPVLIGIAACVARPTLNMRAVGQGYNCTVTANGAAVSGDAELRALAQAAGKRTFLDTDRNTTYRCVGGTIVRLQQAGFEVIKLTVDGVSFP